jgi:molybdenum cofactor cytidylyltransferase
VLVAAVVLAAGGGSRFATSGGAGHKLLAEVEGIPVVVRAVDAPLAAEIGPVWVVQGACDLAGVLGDRPVRLLTNPRWADGMASSLQVAIAAAREAGLDAVVVGLGDQPAILPATWRAVVDQGRSTAVAAAAFGGRPGPPVRLGAEVWDLLPATGDEGARTLLRERSELVTEVPCDGDPRDVDTVEDLDRWS